MRKFIVKTFLFPISLILTYILFYFCLNAYLNSSFGKKSAIYIWGDSQAYQGIDLNELSKTIEKQVYTSAHHGAGVYDFLLFTQQVPENSEVIVSISKLVQIRRKENDYNRSGLSLWALKQLSKNKYSLKENIKILKSNIKPKSNISDSSSLYAYSDSMQIGLPLSHFRSYYQTPPSFLHDKQNLYLIGIQNLINKNCKLTFIEFPFHAELEKIENQSPIKAQTDDFINQIGSLFQEYRIDTIKLDESKNIFHDLSHLNCLGAKELSEKLGKNMIKQERTTIYISKGRGSDK